MAEVVQKKLLVELEQSAEVRRLAGAMASRQTPDFEAWETLMLQAARQGGTGVLGSLLTHWQQHAPREVILCPCGQRMSSRGRRSKGFLTTLGRVPFGRSFYQCAACQQARFPDDDTRRPKGHDMHGNIFEWCRDWYHAQLPGGVDPDLYLAVASSRVRRGGCWADEGWPCRSAFRLRFEPERRYDHIGFRVVLAQTDRQRGP